MLMQMARHSADPRFSSAPGRADKPVSGLKEIFRLMGARMKFERHNEIYGENEPAEYVYQVVSGAVRISKLLSDGRRQISAFGLPADVFGFDCGNEHRFSAEATVDAVVLVMKRSTIEAFAERDIHLAQELWKLATYELGRTQEHMLLLGRTNARERMVAFLRGMARRNHSANVVDLPMSRQDIADYLGLTIETVSRTLSALARAAAIGLPSSRRIVLRSHEALLEATT